MIRARKQCKSCPFKGIDEATRLELAAIPPDEFTCHTLDGYQPGSSGAQCRGHWEARRKFGDALDPRAGVCDERRVGSHEPILNGQAV